LEARPGPKKKKTVLKTPSQPIVGHSGFIPSIPAMKKAQNGRITAPDQTRPPTPKRFSRPYLNGTKLDMVAQYPRYGRKHK
jgi:hypothetical protein